MRLKTICFSWGRIASVEPTLFFFCFLLTLYLDQTGTLTKQKTCHTVFYRHLVAGNICLKRRTMLNSLPITSHSLQALQGYLEKHSSTMDDWKLSPIRFLFWCILSGRRSGSGDRFRHGYCRHQNRVFPHRGALDHRVQWRCLCQTGELGQISTP